jgi:succinate dehydrogenase / fumarate reductase flavoprotein subunit
MILQTLYQQCIKNDVEFYDEFQAIDVIIDGTRIAGILALELASGELHLFHSKAVLFATGGFGRMFKITSNAYANTGDGPALLLRAGVPLMDMEFFQFHPTGIKGMGILITEGVRGEGGILRNSKGDRFMEEYAPTMLDLAPRDMVSRAIMTEIAAGRGINGDRKIDDYVMLDATHLGREVVYAKIPDIADFCKTYLAIDPADEPMPVQPTAHYAMGGIPTDVHGRVTTGTVTYEGLYAAGEAACVSVHGANRLGTNSLVDLVVFGRRAGMHVAEYVKGTDMPTIPDGAEERAVRKLERLRDGSKGPHVGPFYTGMQDSMMKNVGVYRNEGPMLQAVEDVQRLRHQFQEVRVEDSSRAFNSDILGIFELENLLDLALVTAASAVNRRESRGGHSREDYPDRDDPGWLKHTLASLDGDEVKIGYKDVDVSIWEPKPRKY